MQTAINTAAGAVTSNVDRVAAGASRGLAVMLFAMSCTGSQALAQVALDMSYTGNAGSIARTNIGDKMVDRRTRQYQATRRDPSQSAAMASAKCASARRNAASGNGDPTLLSICARAGYR